MFKVYPRAALEGREEARPSSTNTSEPMSSLQAPVKRLGWSDLQRLQRHYDKCTNFDRYKYRNVAEYVDQLHCPSQ